MTSELHGHTFQFTGTEYMICFFLVNMAFLNLAYFDQKNVASRIVCITFYLSKLRLIVGELLVM